MRHELAQVEATSTALGLPTLLESLRDICIKSGKEFNAKKSLEYVVDRSNLVFEQNRIIIRELFLAPTLHRFTCCSKHATNILYPKNPCFDVPSRHFSSSSDENYRPTQRGPTPKPISGKTLDSSRQRRVPSSRMGRVAGFGNLMVGLGIGAAAEMAKRTMGFPDHSSEKPSNPFITDANLERIVNTLCRMRGAALKLGQMLSIQDNSMVSPKVQKMFERVRQSADFMPTRQMYSVINEDLGPDWKSKVASFEEKPFAAASIGQVHRAVLHDGSTVAMKIQYPGISKSIDTDVSNIMLVLKRFDLLPRGMFAEEAIKVAKRELHWECDYIREAAYATHFKKLLADEEAFVVPRVIPELSSRRVYTTEYFDGLVLDDCVSLPQEVRNWIGQKILHLCLKEVFVFHTMQTDPNWSNFLYCQDTGKIVLLDFGASRTYPRKFVDEYLRLIKAAADGNKEAILEHSRNLGFLTGYETKAFVDAHTEAVSILGEAFASKEPFDFGRQSTTRDITALIPVMLEHRLTPPPSESYSLHRKMSGCFLLCSKLNAVVDCRSIFLQIANDYQYDQPDQPSIDCAF
uniref:ABC1 atypical kinase-like domain-containing protein n=1 Tax=Schistocephalus solidus TaxID=70667 RepID=A0A0V0J662_SCHSO